jgi:DNA-binding MarR family transcriptional regulator
VQDTNRKQIIAATKVLAPHNLPYQMFLLVQQMTRRFQDVLDVHHLTPLHWGILCCLWMNDGLRTSDLAQQLEQLGGTITVGLDTMEGRHLVTRKPDDNDGRVSRIFLTRRGKGLQQKLQLEAGSLITDMFSPLSPEDYERLCLQITLLRAHVSKRAAGSRKV